MPTYVYETIPEHPGEEVKTYEIRQSISAAPLTHHPETHEAIHRVITGGAAILGLSKAAPSSASHCGAGCGCHH